MSMSIVLSSCNLIATRYDKMIIISNLKLRKEKCKIEQRDKNIRNNENFTRNDTLQIFNNTNCIDISIYWVGN